MFHFKSLVVIGVGKEIASRGNAISSVKNHMLTNIVKRHVVDVQQLLIKPVDDQVYHKVVLSMVKMLYQGPGHGLLHSNTEVDIFVVER